MHEHKHNQCRRKVKHRKNVMKLIIFCITVGISLMFIYYQNLRKEIDARQKWLETVLAGEKKWILENQGPCLLYTSRLYLLDEPLNGIDLLARDQIMKSILEAIDPDVTLVVSSHLVDELERVADEAIFMKDGILANQCMVCLLYTSDT